MRKLRKNIILTVLMILCMLAGTAVYQQYIGYEIYQGNAKQLQVTYQQVDQAFTLFTQRNWGVLTDWNANLQYIEDMEDKESAWKSFANRKNSWKYSDFYMFNEDDEFLTAAGRSGTADSIRGVFEEMYERGEPVAASYTSSGGDKKIVFASPLQEPFTMGQTTYTGVAVSYDADVVENLIVKDMFGEKSSCYVVNSKGETILSLKPRNGEEVNPGNLFTFLAEQVQFTKNTEENLVNAVRTPHEGYGKFRTALDSYYVICQPVGINDWSIVGIVQAGTIESGSTKIMSVTALMIAALSVCLLILIIRLITIHAKMELEQQQKLHDALEKQKQQLDHLFYGMTQIIDRYAAVDLVNDRYEYDEFLCREGLYTKQGCYHELVEAINSRYVVLSDAENIKMNQLLNAEYLRKTLRKGEGALKIEYGGRTENVYNIMHVVAVHWDAQGVPEKVMLIAQDIGERHELENLANTDGLTGLFNERFFSTVLHRKESKKLPFTLYYLDLDHFKPINDTYGHDMGDKLLKEAAKRLLGCIREQDYVFRIGGDEFTLVIGNQLEQNQAEQMKKRIEEALLQPCVIEGHSLQIGVSCGYAMYPRESEDIAKVRILADQRMYAEKEKNHQKADR